MLTLSRGRLNAGLITLSERVVMDCQSLSRSKMVDQYRWTKLEKQILCNIDKFSPRQLALCMHSVGRSGFSSRKLVHSVSSALTKQLASLTLRDMALVVNAFAKLRIKNEVFLAAALPNILRKIWKTSNPNVGAMALVLDGCLKLGLVGDGRIIEAVISATAKAEIKPLDAVTLLRAIARMDARAIAGIHIQVLNRLAEFVLAAEEEDMVVSGLVALGKISQIDAGLVGNIFCVKLLLERTLDNAGKLSNAKLVHALYSVAVLGPRTNPRKLVEEVIVRGDDFLKATDSPESLAVILVSALNRLAEKTPLNDTIKLMSVADRFLCESSSVAALFNLLSTINLPPSEDQKQLLMQAIQQDTTNAHSAGLVICALAKLECVAELVSVLLQSDPKTLARIMTDQAVYTSLLALLQTRESFGSLPIVSEWISALAGACRTRSLDVSPEAVSQLRIINAIISTNPFHGIQTIPLRTKSSDRAAPIVSGLHREVLETVRHLAPSVSVNTIDETTGYEIDIHLS